MHVVDILVHRFLRVVVLDVGEDEKVVVAALPEDVEQQDGEQAEGEGVGGESDPGDQLLGAGVNEKEYRGETNHQQVAVAIGHQEEAAEGHPPEDVIHSCQVLGQDPQVNPQLLAGDKGKEEAKEGDSRFDAGMKQQHRRQTSRSQAEIEQAQQQQHQSVGLAAGEKDLPVAIDDAVQV